MTTSADTLTDANGNPEEPLEGTPAPTAQVDAEDLSNRPVEKPDEGDHEEVLRGSAKNSEEEPDTFPRSYVEELRQENGKYRQRAQKTDELAQRLHTSLVASTGKLADPTDLEFNEAHLDDEDALTAAVEDLLARKPHLGARKPRGDVGQGVTGSSGSVDLASLLRSRA